MAVTAVANVGEVLSRDGPGSRRAIIDLTRPQQPRPVTADEIDNLATGVARGLLARGCVRGDAIGLLAQNSTEYLICYLAILRAGLVAVPINTSVPSSTVDYICDDAEIRVMFTDETGRRLCPAGMDTLDLAPEALRSLIDPGASVTVRPEPDETALILYTSGSTGRPKGVVRSHASQWAMINGMSDDARAAFAGKRTLIAAPLYHMNGLLFSEIALHLECTIVLLARFRPDTFVWAIDTQQVDIITGVPTMLARLAAEEGLFDGTDCASVQLIFIGSAPLTEPVVQLAKRLFPRATLLNGYGTTESGGAIFGAHPDGRDRPPLSVGYPAPHVQVRLVDGAAPEEGVLEIKSPSNMTGYKNLPDVTAQRLRDGWYRTGDVMRLDGNGFYYFVGREDDMFVCNGENVYPGELEAVLERHPDISQACVVPVPDEIRGQMPVAFVVLRPGANLSERALKDFALANAPPYMHPRRAIFLSEMPLAGTNKIDRSSLARRARTP